jgi:hypothetical protein
MLENLRPRIAELAAAHGVAGKLKISRTIRVLVSDTIPDSAVSLDSFLLYDPRGAKFYPTIRMTGDEQQFRLHATEAVQNAFHPDFFDFMQAGFTRVDSANQVIFVADLAEAGVLDRLKKSVEIMRSLISDAPDQQEQVYWTTIFLCRRHLQKLLSGAGNGANSAANDTTNAGGHQIGWPDVSQLLRDTLAFDHVFAIDARNPKGLKIATNEDFHSLLTHLIYYLALGPVAEDTCDDFINWLDGSADEAGQVSGLSALSLNLPVREIAELAIVQCGVEIVRKAFLVPIDFKRGEFYVNNYCGLNHLEGFGNLVAHCFDKPTSPLDNPVDELEELKLARPAEDLQRIRRIHDSLETMTAENERRMAEFADRLHAQWTSSMEDHIDWMISSESGGLKLAEEYLLSLQKRLQSVIPKNGGTTSYTDSQQSLQEADELLAKRPSTAAILVRVTLLAAGGVACLCYGSSSLIFPLVMLAGCLALVPLVMFMGHKELAECVSEARKYTVEKWKALTRQTVERELVGGLTTFLGEIKEAQLEVRAAINRLGEIVKYFKEEYQPPLPQEKMTWKYLIKERAQLSSLTDRLKVNVDEACRLFQRDHLPPYSWRRLAKHASGQPDEWEGRLVETAAIVALPGCDEIFNLRVLDFLSADFQMPPNKVVTLMQSQFPFVCYNPNIPMDINSRTVLEVADGTLGSKLISKLRESQDNLRVLETKVPFRVTYFQIVDGIPIDSLAHQEG